MQEGPGDTGDTGVTKDMAVRGTAWDLPYLDSHAELVQGSRAAYWVVIQPAGTLSVPVDTPDGDIATPHAETSAAMVFLGYLVNRIIFRGRWSVRLVAADEHGRATRRVLHRERVPEDAALTHALHLQREVEAGRLPRSTATS